MLVKFVIESFLNAEAEEHRQSYLEYSKYSCKISSFHNVNLDLNGRVLKYKHMEVFTLYAVHDMCVVHILDDKLVEYD